MQLPQDVWNMIFGYLSTREMIDSMRTSIGWLNCIVADSERFRDLTAGHWHPSVLKYSDPNMRRLQSRDEELNEGWTCEFALKTFQSVNAALQSRAYRDNIKILRLGSLLLDGYQNLKIPHTVETIYVNWYSLYLPNPSRCWTVSAFGGKLKRLIIQSPPNYFACIPRLLGGSDVRKDAEIILHTLRNSDADVKEGMVGYDNVTDAEVETIRTLRLFPTLHLRRLEASVWDAKVVKECLAACPVLKYLELEAGNKKQQRALAMDLPDVLNLHPTVDCLRLKIYPHKPRIFQVHSDTVFKHVKQLIVQECKPVPSDSCVPNLMSLFSTDTLEALGLYVEGMSNVDVNIISNALRARYLYLFTSEKEDSTVLASLFEAYTGTIYTFAVGSSDRERGWTCLSKHALKRKRG